MVTKGLLCLTLFNMLKTSSSNRCKKSAPWGERDGCIFLPAFGSYSLQTQAKISLYHVFHRFLLDFDPKMSAFWAYSQKLVDKFMLYLITDYCSVRLKMN